MISRDDALILLEQENMEKSLFNHCLQTEAVMQSLAKNFGEDEQLWAITGLLHDLDYSQTKNDPARHGLVTAELLQEKLPEEALQAIRAHNGEMNGSHPQTKLDFALRCGETVTGLISANALVRPEGMQGMKPKSLKKKMKDKSFAASVNRDTIMECEKIGLESGEFFKIAIEAIESMPNQVDLS